MTESIENRQQNIVEDFSLFGDWMEKYEYIIDLGKSVKGLDEKFKTDEYLVKGCQSKVWLNANFENGLLHFLADSDAIITKGIIALLIQILDGQSPHDVMNADLWFIDKIGLREHLSHNRSNGLSGMIKQMKLFAIAYQSQQEI